MNKVLSILVALILISCESKEENTESKKQEIPGALQEKSIDLGRYSKGNGNLIEELYQDLLTKSPELKSLETELGEFNSKETQDKFLNYDEKSNDYYRSAKNQTDGITDTITKNKIIALIKKSNEKYLNKTAELNDLLKSIHNKKIQ